MPNYKEDTQQYHLERVREVLALKPQAGARTIQEILAGDPDAPLNLHPHYILKLRRKIEGERVHRFDAAKVEQRISEIQDRTESVIAQMWRILLDNSKHESTRVGAAKVIIDAEDRLFKQQLDAGIFERKPIEVRHTHGLAPEMQFIILRALQNYGIVKQPDGKPAELPQPRTGAVAH